MTQRTRDLLVLVYTLLLWVSLWGLNFSEIVHTDWKKGEKKISLVNNIPFSIKSLIEKDKTSTAQKALF